MECPKCHNHIKSTEWGQTCKKCGVNLIYYNLEEQLFEDAKHTELCFGKLRVFAAKAKAAFVGGKLQIVRLVMLFGCIGLLMIPFATVKVNSTLCDSEISFNALNVYNAFSDKSFDALNAMSSSAIVGAASRYSYLLMLSFFVLAAVCILQIVSVVISMANPKKISALTAAFSALGVAGCVFSFIMALCLKSAAQATGFINFKLGFGAFAALVGFAAMLVINIILAKKLEVRYKPGDLYRREMFFKVKSGEVKLSELPLPVFETEEEKAERLEEYAKDRELLNKSASSDGDKKEQKEEALNG